jgi:malate dehydrogenase
MTTAAIIGAGELGGAIAHALARRDSAARVVLVDPTGNVAAGKALDIRQSGAIDGFRTELDGTTDATRITACDVCIVADRAGQGSPEWQGDEGSTYLTQLLPFIQDAPIVFAGAAQASMILALARDARVPRTHLLGSAPEALASAVRAIVAMEARCSPTEVMLTVLGTPPEGFVVPWTEASIGGYALEQVLTQVELARVNARAARLWPPGPFALGQAAACVAHGILHSGRRAYSVLTVLDGEFNTRGRVGALPALLSATGIVHTRVPALTTRERVQLETSLSRS